MCAKNYPNREVVRSLVLDSLRSILEEREEETRGMQVEINEETVLYGFASEINIDSLTLVTLVLDVEQRIETDYGIRITLADEKAMSQRNSPFRSIGTLVNYVMQLIEEDEHHAGQ